jgi:hypothetical protein
VTTEQLFATIVGIVVATASATEVSGFVLWVFLSAKGARGSDHLTHAA